MDLYTILQTLNNLEEGTMAAAEKHKTGPKFTGYWMGKDSGVPGEKMVGGGMEEQNIGPGTGGMEEEDQIEEELRAAWDEYLAEFGANNPGSTNAQSQANTAKDLQTAQQNINKLKSAGVNLPTGVSQASQSAVKAVNEPTSVPTAQDKKLSQTLGGEFEQLLTKGKPSDVSQLANAIRQVKQGLK